MNMSVRLYALVHWSDVVTCFCTNTFSPLACIHESMEWVYARIKCWQSFPSPLLVYLCGILYIKTAKFLINPFFEFEKIFRLTSSHLEDSLCTFSKIPSVLLNLQTFQSFKLPSTPFLPIFALRI